ncbi:MAG: hypothetical protein JWN73_3545 [Betaproteobacteria bacterium]|nr:hypothetical protein [Betaproteobacteria bacterium]
MSLVRDLPMGLMPCWFPGDSRPKLVVKASKEALLAAKINLGFKIYMVPLLILGVRTIGLVTAFFDDQDEPLVITTPMFKEAPEHDLRRLISGGEFDIHFFDENNHELLGYEAKVHCLVSTRDHLQSSALLEFDLASARSAIDQMGIWFGLRSDSDDLAAISVEFGESLVPDDIFIQDMRPKNHLYQGSRPFSFTQLHRKEPGAFQERDIVQLLSRIFAPEEIYLNPLRVTDKEEIADILVITHSRAIFVQAKDSPNVEKILRNAVSRKKATTVKALTKAIDQTRGSFRYARSKSPMQMIVGGNIFEISLEGLELRALIVVKELFIDEYSVYSPPILSLAKELSVSCISLDYSELHMYTMHLDDEEAFVEAWDRVFAHGVQTSMFPRLRFGLSN